MSCLQPLRRLVRPSPFGASESTVGFSRRLVRRHRATLDGDGLVVGDYFDLVYNPEHHHLRRDFVVFFAAPIGEACGLMVADLAPFAPEALQVVSLVDCARAAVSTCSNARAGERRCDAPWSTRQAVADGPNPGPASDA